MVRWAAAGALLVASALAPGILEGPREDAHRIGVESIHLEPPILGGRCCVGVLPAPTAVCCVHRVTAL